MENLNILEGLLITIGVISLWKVIRFKFVKEKEGKFSILFWVAHNWADYAIHVGVTLIFYFWEEDVLGIINPLLLKIFSWEIPVPKDSSFWFILGPAVTALFLYPILRKKLAKPLQELITPTILESTVNPDRKRPNKSM